MPRLNPILATLALVAAPMLAQAPPAPGPTPPTPSVQAAAEASSRDFRTRLFVVQHRSPKALCEVVRPLGSGARGSTVDYTDRDGLKAISVRDFPENLATIEAALKRLDVPAAAQSAPEVELHVHVLFAGKAEGPSEGFPEELKEVLKSLRSTLAYRSFSPVTSFVQRAKSGSSHLASDATLDVSGLGEAGDKGPARLKVEFLAQYLEVTGAGSESPRIAVTDFRAEVGVFGTPVRAAVRTDLTLKDGEKVVVGTSALRDKGLIVVVTAKILK